MWCSSDQKSSLLPSLPRTKINLSQFLVYFAGTLHGLQGAKLTSPILGVSEGWPGNKTLSHPCHLLLIWQKNWPCCQHLNTHTDHIRTQTWDMYIFKSHCFVENLLMMHYWSRHIDLCHSREKRNPGSPQIPSVSHFSSSLDPSSQLWKRGRDVAHVGWITLEQLPRQVLACTVALNVWIPAT